MAATSSPGRHVAMGSNTMPNVSGMDVRVSDVVAASRMAADVDEAGQSHRDDAKDPNRQKKSVNVHRLLSIIDGDSQRCVPFCKA